VMRRSLSSKTRDQSSRSGSAEWAERPIENLTLACYQVVAAGVNCGTRAGRPG